MKFRGSKNSLLLLLFLMLLISLYWSSAGATANKEEGYSHNEPIAPVPTHHGQDASRVALGKQLFHDSGLSANGTVSCASCHALHNGGVDGLEKSFGIHGQQGDRNSPTVLNSGLLFALFWDGRAASLEEQLDGPINDKRELGSSWEKIIAYLKSKPSYTEQFKQIYGKEPDRQSAANAIASFERSLLTPNGPFDRYLKGEKEAISAEAREGYELFKSYGCSSCHQGRAVGGNMYEKLGIVKPFYGVVRKPTKSDLGRFNQTGKEAHRYEFKVPSLRNVARTPPYLHDGSIKTLEMMVVLMGEHQLGRRIPDEHVSRIVEFLKTLSGELSE